MVMRFSVIIVTYRRPDCLTRCLKSLVAQTRGAAEIIVVGQGDDSEAGRVVSAAARDAGGPMRWEYTHLDEPNMVVALNAGIARASGDVIAFIDDDAVARHNWLETFARWYEDPEVGAVGGPNVDFWDGRPTIKRARKVGRLTWYGRVISKHYCLTDGPQEVQFLRGCNMSFRRHLLVEIPTTLLPYWSSNEIFLTGAVKKRGFRLIFDPAAPVDHYPELRRRFVGVGGASKASRERTLTRNDAHNFVYALLSVIPGVQKPLFLFYDFLFGNRRTPGLGRALTLWLAGRRGDAARLWPSLKGKLSGIRTYLKALAIKPTTVSPVTYIPTSQGRECDSVAPKYSVCICTNRRLKELKRAIESVLRNDYENWELIISDDGRDDEVARYASGLNDARIRYYRGPARGVAANRNNCVKYARGQYIAYLDDDVIMDRRLISAVDRVLLQNPGFVVTGFYKENGADVPVPSFDFLGYMTKVPKDLNDLEMITQGAVVFPREVFETVAFDENIVYGYEEADIAAQIKYLCGRRIVFCKDAYNYHYPSSASREAYPRVIHASRIYTTGKKYFLFRRQYLRGVIYIAVAFVHLLAHAIKTAWQNRSLRPLISYFDTILLVIKYWLRFVKAGQQPPLLEGPSAVPPVGAP